jgi:hypothetical protein
VDEQHPRKANCCFAILALDLAVVANRNTTDNNNPMNCAPKKIKSGIISIERIAFPK